MDTFALLPDEEKQAYFVTAAKQLDLHPELIEKDFWVCWVCWILMIDDSHPTGDRQGRR